MAARSIGAATNTVVTIVRKVVEALPPPCKPNTMLSIRIAPYTVVRGFFHLLAATCAKGEVWLEISDC